MEATSLLSVRQALPLQSNLHQEPSSIKSRVNRTNLRLSSFTGAALKTSNLTDFVDTSHETYYLNVSCGKKRDKGDKKNKGGCLSTLPFPESNSRPPPILLAASPVADFAPIGLEPDSSASTPDIYHQLNLYSQKMNDVMDQLNNLSAQVKSLRAMSKKKCKDSSSSSSSSSSGSSSCSSDDEIVKVNDRRKMRNRQSVPAIDAPVQCIDSTEAVSVAAPGQYSAIASVPVDDSRVPLEATTGVIKVTPYQAEIRSILESAFKAAPAQPRIDSRSASPVSPVPSLSSSTHALASTAAVKVDAGAGTVQVCLGGKCKRSGAQDILSTLQSSVSGASGVSVSGCKCMGKCRSAPNVKVTESGNSNPVIESYVEVEDVQSLLHNHFGVGNFPCVPANSAVFAADVGYLSPSIV